MLTETPIWSGVRQSL